MATSRRKQATEHISLLGLLLIFVLPFAVVVYQLIAEINYKIEFAQKEFQGNAYLRPLRHLLEHVPQNRLLAHHYLSQGGFQAELLENQSQIDQDLKNLKIVKQKLGNTLVNNEKLETLQQDWNTLKEKTLSLKPSYNNDIEIQALHNHLISEIRDLISQVGDISNLILDPDLDSYYLMDTTLLKLPEYQDLLAQLNLFGEDIIKRQTLTPAEKERLIELSDLVRANSKAINKGIKLAFRANNKKTKNLQPSLEKPLQEIENNTNNFLDQLNESVINAQRINIQALKYSNEAQKTLHNSFEFWDLTVNELDNVLEHDRIDKFSKQKYFVEAFALFVLLIVVYIFIISIRQLKDRQRAEEAMRQAEEKYRSIFENAADGIFQATPDGCYTSANPALAQIYGYNSPEELITSLTDIEQQLYVEPERRRKFVCQLQESDAVSEFEAQVYRKDGRVIWVLENARILRDGNGHILGYEGTVKEISDRKQTEQELKKAKEEAESANVAKSAFLANMSHELRTPLNAILGFAQIMERDPHLVEQQREYLSVISRSGEHLLGLINDVLAMSKIEAGQTTIARSPFDMNRMLQSIEEMMRVRAEAKHLQLLFETAPDMPPYICSDESKLRQILVNLLGNAVKFTQEGGVGLRVAYQPSETAPRLLFEIEDTGVGIAQSEIGKLFQPFVQAESGTIVQEGTGLGLAISRQFVNLMGGDISVESIVGQGTIFKFDVQVALANVEDVQYTNATRHVIGIAPEDRQDYRILVVDDKQENRRLLIEWLQILGFQLQEATNGLEAIAIWEEWEPHLIWMDMRMPVMDGYEATRRIKASIKGQATVVIALTASAFDHERAIVLSAGCDDFVRKPVRESVFFGKIAEHLGVQFVYDEPLAVEVKPVETDLTPQMLVALPAQCVSSLRQAVEEIDVDTANDVIKLIGESDRALAAALSNLVANYRFDQLQELLQETGLES